MRRYAMRRLLQMVPLLIGVSMVVFALTELMPGDYISSMVPPEETAVMSEEQIEELREAYGLDKPAYVRYFLWLGRVLRGDLGKSLASGEPVMGELIHYMPPTLYLTVSAFVLSCALGIVLGVISAVKQYSWVDQLLTLVGFVWISTPAFVFAIAGLFLFSLKHDVLPSSGMGSYGEKKGLLDMLHHLVLPASVLGLRGIARYIRYTRDSLLNVMREDYLTVARAKGLRERTVLLGHAMRNALIPVITIIGLDVPWVLSGAIIVERIFAWPGVGSYYMVAVLRRNYTVIMGVNLVLAVAVMASNLLADLSYAAIDPRIRYE